MRGYLVLSFAHTFINWSLYAFGSYFIIYACFYFVESVLKNISYLHQKEKKNYNVWHSAKSSKNIKTSTCISDILIWYLQCILIQNTKKYGFVKSDIITWQNGYIVYLKHIWQINWGNTFMTQWNSDAIYL